jgi:hypothetical protein
MFNLKAMSKTIVLLCIVHTSVFAQHNEPSLNNATPFKLHEKGKFFINWGYNRAWYPTSDIHFTGQGHDFILYDVTAKDRPSELNADYINPETWSIPQFNFRFGYHFADKYSVSIGWDHMKYVVNNYQTVKMYGTLDPSQVPDPLMSQNMAQMNALYAPNGLYNYTDVVIDPDMFLAYEHTDGFNYASVDVERYDKLWQHTSYDKLGVTFMSGLGVGTIVPRTDAHLFGSGRNHYWNIAGWGANAKIGLQINILKWLFLETDFKTGYVQMLNVHTSNHYDIDKAKQNVVFFENNWMLGFRF